MYSACIFKPSHLRQYPDSRSTTPIVHKQMSSASIEDYRGDKADSSIDAEREMDEVIRIVTNASQQADGGVLAKLSTLSKQLSTRSKTPRAPYDLESEEDFDFKRILKTFIKSADEQGIHLRSTGVSFTDLKVTGVDASASFVPNVFGFLDIPSDIVNAIKTKNKTTTKDILRNVNGFVKPGEMCLVLGRPGAGCSTLLKTLAGQLDQFSGVQGEVAYDNIPQKEMLHKYRPDLIYNGELDVHYPHLTVDQTLRFSIGCKTPNTRVNNSTREQYILANRDLLATIFGLRHTYNTKVGNDFVRGVSGGERKRVSIAEAMSCKASVYCWDNATRGLDASTALEYAQAIRVQTSLTKSVAFITIYQAGENIYETFDKVLLLYEGRQIYFGKAEDAKQFFVDMGFECPERQATAEFLTAITDPIGRSARAGFENSVPRNADEFEQRWLQSDEFKKLQQEMASYQSSASADQTREKYDLSLAQEKKRAHYHYTVGYPTQMKLLIRRGFQRIYGDMAFTITNIVAAGIQSLIAGSLYWATPLDTSGAFSRGGMIYFFVLYFSLMGLAEVAGQFAERPILMKQKSYSLFHPSAEVLSSVIFKFPFKLIAITVFFIISYFLANLTRDAWRFFLSLLFLITSSEAIFALFQMVAALSNDVAGANAVAGLFMLILSTYSGFMIQKKSMHPWFKWLIYINPISYGFENMMTNEFHGREMNCGGTLIPSGAGYTDLGAGEQVCAFAGSEPGNPYVNGDSYLKTAFDYSFSNNWRNFGIMIAFLVFFIFVNAVATEFKRPVKGGGDHLIFKKTKETLNKLKNSYANKAADIESGEQSAHDIKLQDLSSNDQSNDVFKGLGSKKVFAWQNVDYVIPYQGGPRKLLDNVQGYVKPGTLTALMGESGAGKTTLLNVLAQRIDMGTITGDFLVNGAPLDSSFQRSTGYVQQQDLHVAELTVRESLQFAARLRRPNSVPDAEKLEYVETIISILGMSEYADAIVGGLGAGLNVEQRKKLSIGVELVAKPSLLLFLDEPTSGLDSQSAWAIVNLLQRLAAAGQSILCTIHQPSATLFEAFDRLLLLKKGGQTVYFGDIGENSKTILEYFERNGARPCAPKENPAEYILEAIGAGATASVKEDWFEIWKRSDEYKQTTAHIEKIKHVTVEDSDDLTDAERAEMSNTYAMPYLLQLKYVTMRTFVQFIRSPEYIMGKFMLYLAGGLFIGFTFWDLDSNIVGMQNGMFAVFLSIIMSAPASNQIQERAVAARELFEVRESKSNTFHWSTLLLAQFLNEIPYHFVITAIYFCCLYFPMKIDDSASRAGVFYLNYSIMYQLYTISFALMVIYFSPDLPSSLVITGLFLSFMISFCGVVQPASLMPGFWTFMYKVSPLTYFVQTFMSLVLHDKPVICSADEYSYFNPPSGQTCKEFIGPFLEFTQRGYINNPEATANCAYCTYSVADEYMLTVGVKYSYIWRNFGFMWVYVIFNIAAMCSLYYLFRVSNINVFSPINKLIGKVKSLREKK